MKDYTTKLEEIKELYPQAEIGIDQYGQIVIYTNEYVETD